MQTLRLSLAGTAILVLLCGMGGAVVAQEEETEPDEFPTGPARFEWLNGFPDPVVATDPRMGGSLTQRAPNWVEVPTGNGVIANRARLTNDAGAWECWVSGYAFGYWEKTYEQWWCVGEDAYEGLSAVMFNSWDSNAHGLIYEGVPPAMPALAEPPADD
jgi:hypothetical protein